MIARRDYLTADKVRRETFVKCPGTKRERERGRQTDRRTPRKSDSGERLPHRPG